MSVWKTVWSPILLKIVNMGIYGAWAYCKVAALFVDNTSLITEEV